MRTTLVALVLVLLVVGCRGAGAPDVPPDGAVVVAVVDGDTVEVRVASGATEPVRLVGIDTPESVAPDRPVECHGPEASAALAELLPPGTEVRLERDEEGRDRFGRLLAYVFRRSDGLFVNEAMAAGGHAEALSIPPNTAYDETFRAAVASARGADLGLWGAC